MISYYHIITYLMILEHVGNMSFRFCISQDLINFGAIFNLLLAISTGSLLSLSTQTSIQIRYPSIAVFYGSLRSLRRGYRFIYPVIRFVVVAAVRSFTSSDSRCVCAPPSASASNHTRPTNPLRPHTVAAIDYGIAAPARSAR